jgi:hypothetical protein
MPVVISQKQPDSRDFCGSIAPDLPHSLRGCLTPEKIRGQWEVYDDSRVRNPGAA